MNRKLEAHYIRAYTGYKSPAGNLGVTGTESGLQFEGGLYVGGSFSAGALPISTDNILITGTEGDGYIEFTSQDTAPALANVNIYSDVRGHFAIGNSGPSAYAITFGNALLTADRSYDWPNKDGTVAMTDDDISQFNNDSGFVVGPGGAIDSRIASFNGTTGRIIKDSGINLSGTAGKNLDLSGSLTIGADTTVTGGGTVALGGFTLTIPATGTAVLTSRTISEGAGLAGNTYDLSANRTLAMGTPSTLSIASTNAASGTTHSHVITTSSNPGAAAAILSSDASGYLTLKRLTLTDYLFINASTANLYLKDTSTGFQSAATSIVTPQSGNAFRTTGFSSGVSGWNQSNNGDAEFNNVRIRGELAASVFKVSEVSATAGTFGVFYSAAALYADCTTPASTSSSFTFDAKNSDAGGMLFAVNDIVRFKSWTGAAVSDSWATITARTDHTTYATYTATLSSGSTSKTFRAGTAVVDYGPSGTGFITLSADGTVGSSPNLTMATHAGSPWSAQTTLLRLGNLNGWGGYVTDVYGLAVGDYATGNYLIADNGGVSITGAQGSLKINSSGIKLNGSASLVGRQSLAWYPDVGNESESVSGVYNTYSAGSSITRLWSALRSSETSSGENVVALETRKPGGATTLGTTSRFELHSDVATATSWALLTLGTVDTPTYTFSGLTIGSANTPTHMLDVYGSGWFQDGAVVPASTGTAQFALDSSPSTDLSIANNATATPFGNANNFSGLFIVNNTSSGQVGVFIQGGGTMILVNQTGSEFTTTSGTASSTNVYLSGLVVTIQNKLGGTRTYNVMALRTRASA